jgi:hypothetical protein
MSEISRNRSEGWQHAKISGHENEESFGAFLMSNHDAQEALFLAKFDSGFRMQSLGTVDVDGAKKVPSLLGDITTSKVDLMISWPQASLNISLKKSLSGQVWLVSVDRFLAAMDFYGASASEDVQKALSLFIGGANLNPYSSEFALGLSHERNASPSIYAQSAHQQRLLAVTLLKVFPDEWFALLDYFETNIGLITWLMFAKGLALDSNDEADLIVYNNVFSRQNIFNITELMQLAQQRVKDSPIQAGPRNGGSTLLLPTGFMQMHHPQGENLIQFHHKFSEVFSLFSDA